MILKEGNCWALAIQKKQISNQNHISMPNLNNQATLTPITDRNKKT